MAVLAAALLVAGACSSDDTGSSSGPESDAAQAGPAQPSPDARVPATELRPLHVEDGRIIDDLGRDVLLRGTNLNSLAEYHQADPSAAPTAPVTDGDWDAMAEHGFSVARLLMSWSRLEPEPGRIDDDYLDQLAGAVEAATERGIYVVLDMHQDAWGPYIASPPGVLCDEDERPAIGWDGAPEWATITDGASTCVTGNRESAPAVRTAFTNFYANTPGPDGVGLRDRLVEVWGAVALRFAGTAGLAGYDLLNEPNHVDPPAENLDGYSTFVADSIAAIRSAEKVAGSPPAPVFVEPLLLYPLPETLPSLTDGGAAGDADLVFAPHNYAESIGPKVLSVEQTFEIDQAGADELGAALWIGEYGYWDTSAETLAVARRFAAEEDRRGLGGAWWQWRQTCGDPHSVGSPGATATSDQIHLNATACPGDADLGPTEEFLSILGRAYPRAAPGRLRTLASDPATGALSLTATGAEPGSELVVWVPAPPGGAHATVNTSAGLENLGFTDVHGGAILTATTTSADYSLDLART